MITTLLVWNFDNKRPEDDAEKLVITIERVYYLASWDKRLNSWVESTDSQTVKDVMAWCDLPDYFEENEP